MILTSTSSLAQSNRARFVRSQQERRGQMRALLSAWRSVTTSTANHASGRLLADSADLLRCSMLLMSCTSTSQNDRPAIQQAFRCNAADKIILYMLEKNPDVANQKNKDGNLPLSVAVKNVATEEIVTILLEAYPEATRSKNNVRQQFPSDAHCAHARA
eukprot:2614926-Pleurochrysis_carterae.AAC.1